MKSLLQTIAERRSIRKFQSKPIPDELLQRILESARWAPSGGNSQPWSFGVVKSREAKQALAAAAGEQYWIAEAPVVIACCAQLVLSEEESEFSRRVNRLRWGEAVESWMTAAPASYRALVLGNASPHIPGAHIQLTAAHYGIGSCWVGFLDIARASEILGLPENWRCYYLIPLGYPAEEPVAPERKPLADLTFAESWGQTWQPAQQGPQLGEVVLRTYREEDEDQWLRVWGQVAVGSQAWVLLHHSKPHYENQALELVAEVNGEIVGFMDVEIEDKPGQLGYLDDSRCGFVWEFGVLPEYRGRGIARRMVEYAQEWLEQRGIRRMEFWSADKNAQSFYQRFGMNEMERHWQYFIDLPADLLTELKKDKVYIFYAYGSAPYEGLEELKKKYKPKTISREKPEVCIGFDYRW